MHRVFDDLKNGLTWKIVLASRGDFVCPAIRQYCSMPNIAEQTASAGAASDRYRVAVCRLDAGASIYRFTVCSRCKRFWSSRWVIAAPPKWSWQKLGQSTVRSLYFVGKHGNNDACCQWSQDRGDAGAVSSAGQSGRATVAEPRSFGSAVLWFNSEHRSAAYFGRRRVRLGPSFDRDVLARVQPN